jgi:hypothetical protein
MVLGDAGQFSQNLQVIHGPGHGCDQCQITYATNQNNSMMADAMARFGEIQSHAMAEDADTRSHEAAHQAAGGSLAGQARFGFRTVSIQMPDGTAKSVTYAAEGSVPIAMPGVPSAAPQNDGERRMIENVRSQLKTVQAAATAPGARMSGADAAIASTAASGLSMLSGLLAQSPLKPADSRQSKGAASPQAGQPKGQGGGPKGSSGNRLNVIG